MTRMWMTDPSVMCSEHLQREHHEIHQLVEQLRCQWNMPPEHQVAKIIGHLVRGQVFPTYVRDRHDELVTELDDRDIRHDTPIEQPDIADVYPADPTPYLQQYNQRELARRCTKCRAQMPYTNGGNQ